MKIEIDQQTESSLSTSSSPFKGRIFKQLQRRSKPVLFPADFVEEQLNQAKEFKANLHINWLAYLSKGKQPELNVGKTTRLKHRTKVEYNNYSIHNTAKQRREERMKKFDIDFEKKLQLEKACLERRKLEPQKLMKEYEMKHQLLE